jgi:hypothetical protein
MALIGLIRGEAPPAVIPLPSREALLAAAMPFEAHGVSQVRRANGVYAVGMVTVRFETMEAMLAWRNAGQHELWR